jgi:hypothetical protein
MSAQDIDLGALPILKGRGLSDLAIAHMWHCSRRTIFNYRQRLGISPTKWRVSRRTERRAREAEIDRLWARLDLDEKIGLLLSHVPYRVCQKRGEA